MTIPNEKFVTLHTSNFHFPLNPTRGVEITAQYFEILSTDPSG